jgi:hypothetical protein
MKREKNLFKGYVGANPFRDHQARTFSNSRLVVEFFPTSIFWSLFNDQHEVLLGRRGSGKTIMLRMMRYSLLKKINDPRAKKLIEDKRYFGITVSTHLEFIGNLIHQEIPEKDRLLYFQFAFNCMLSRAFLIELKSLINEKQSFVEKGQFSRLLTKEIAPVWFPSDWKDVEIKTIDDLDKAIASLYESSSVHDGFINSPQVFKNTICTPIQAISSFVAPALGFKEEPTWLICIDEAEFLPEIFQRCINTLFRADSRKIVVKMATLPFKHQTKETLSPGIFAESNGNDFSYRMIDMDDEIDDFIHVTNNLCRTRIKKALGDCHVKIDSLEDFVGKVGNDDWIDYYKMEIGEKNCSYENIIFGIRSQFSPERRQSVPRQRNIRKQTYDKYAPIYFFREMYKMSQKGNYTPGWFAGSRVIRKISEGNPRMFIKIMNEIFEGAKNSDFGLKAQHKIIFGFVRNECSYLQSMPSYGPILHPFLNEIALELKNKAHGGYLIFAGNNFKISKNQIERNKKLIDAIKEGVAYMHLRVDEKSMLNNITSETAFSLSNYISAFYWIPMRKGELVTIKLRPKQEQLPGMEM